MSNTDFVILGLLSESPLTGYQIKKIIDIRFRFFWSESYGQLYPTLKSLKGHNLIEELEPDGNHNRSQKTYKITQKGLAELKQWLYLPVEKESIRLELLLKLYFSNLIDQEVIINHIKSFQQSHEHDLMILNLFEKELKSIPDQDLNHTQILRVIDFGQKVNEAYLQWSLETINLMKGTDNK